MTNKEVSSVFTDIYNGFWMKHRDSLPDISDSVGWEEIVNEGKQLMKKHNCFLARNLVSDLIAIMDFRARKGNAE